MASPQIVVNDVTYEATTSAGVVVLADADFALVQVIDNLIKVLRGN